jgi:hypothetical protein
MGPFCGLFAKLRMQGPNSIAYAGIFHFIGLPNTGNFACIEHMGMSGEGITGKAVNNSAF